MLHEFASEIALAVTFNYGANHNSREIAFARENCRRLGIELLEIDMQFLSRIYNSALFDGAEAVPTENYDDSNMRSTVVPFRNGIMLAVAAGLAESRNLAAVMIANHAGDHAIYPDCRPAFIDAMSKATEAGTYNGVKVIAPYTNLSKGEIVARGAAIGVDYSNCYSCYCGGEIHCGCCATCRERREAFRVAGVPDPTLYEK